MTKQDDLKKHFEAILGRDLIGPEGGVVVLRESTGSYTQDEGWLTTRHIGTTGDSTKFCGAANLMDVSGFAITGQDGTIEFMLSDFFCGLLFFEYPANLVATSRSQTPTFLSAVASPTNDRRDVTVRVACWNLDGSPAPNTPFDWRCRVPFQRVIL